MFDGLLLYILYGLALHFVWLWSKSGVFLSSRLFVVNQHDEMTSRPSHTPTSVCTVCTVRNKLLDDVLLVVAVDVVALYCCCTYQVPYYAP